MCIHYWLINSRNQSVCKLCGERKQEYTHFEISNHLVPLPKHEMQRRKESEQEVKALRNLYFMMPKV